MPRKKDRKKFSETKVGKFLKDKGKDIAGDVISIVGDVANIEVLERIGDKIKNSDKLTEEEREHALELLKMDMQEMQEISNRWQFDMEFGNTLSKSARPLVLLWLVLLFTIMIVLSFFGVLVPNNYLNVFEIVLLTVIGSYFGARTIEKYHRGKVK